jgi:branched-chain amino acid transport system permease protein
MAYDLLYGYTGIASFGHSVFFGMGAYSVGIIAVTVFGVANPLIHFAVAIVVGAMLGLLIGFFCTFTKGIYTALVSFAFAHVFWLLVMANPMGITRGESGITGVRPPPIYVGNFEVNFFRGVNFYFLVIIILIISYVILKTITHLPIGDVLKGIRENENRLLSLGYDVRQYKLFAFVVSGIFSAISGVLMAYLDNVVVPQFVQWDVGATVLLMTILGGSGTLIGPLLGSFVVELSKAYVTPLLGGGNWVFFLGSLYILVIILMPRGIYGLLKRSFPTLAQNKA